LFHRAIHQDPRPGLRPNIDTTLRATLQLYPGKPPVMVNELNAWIDRKLGYRATHPDFCEQEDV